MAEMRGVFDFFGLPREIKDMAYAELLQENIHIRDPLTEWKLLVGHFPDVNCLLVSRQFGSGLRDSIERWGVLRNTITGYRSTRRIDCSLSLVFTNITWLDISIEHFVHFDTDTLSEMAMHTSWIDELTKRMPRLSKTTINVATYPLPLMVCHQTIIINAVKQFDGVPNVQSVYVRLEGTSCEYNEYVRAGETEISLTPSRANGPLEIVRMKGTIVEDDPDQYGIDSDHNDGDYSSDDALNASDDGYRYECGADIHDASEAEGANDSKNGGSAGGCSIDD